MPDFSEPRSPDSTVPMYQIHSEMGNSTLKSSSHCSADTDDSFTKTLRNDPAETLRKRPKKVQARKEKSNQLEVNDNPAQRRC